MQPLISVIVPVYNVELYLHRCVDSILAQTYTNLEIILVDDGSPDKCGEICDEYAGKNAKVKAIHKINGGLSDARNVALTICKGEYITFIDSDDYVGCDYVKYLYELLVKNSSDISVCNMAKVYNKGKLRLSENDFELVFSKVEALETMLYQRYLDTSACGKLYKRNLFKTIRYPVGMLYEDFATTYHLLHLCERISYGNRMEYYYFQRPCSIMNKPFNVQKMQLIDIADEVLLFVGHEYPQIERAAICRLISSNFQIYLQMPRNKQLFQEEKQRIVRNIRKYRKTVLMAKKARLKNRLSCWASFLGMGFVSFLWRITKTK